MDLYHSTPAADVPSILRDGLRLQSPTWPIHLATQPGFFEDLVRFCHDVDDVVTLRIKADNLAVSPGMDGPGSLTSYRDIPAGLISQI